MTPTRLALRALLTMALVWLMAKYFPQYLSITGGLAAVIVTGALLTLLNLFVRPLLNVITFPLKLFATIIAIVLANAVFLWMVMWVTERMDPTLIQFQIRGGIWGWIVVSLMLGTMNWVLKEILHKHE
jgi:putative membrane protein